MTPSALVIGRIAEACGVSTDWLITGQGRGPQAIRATGTEG